MFEISLPSPLFEFCLSDLDKLEYGDYTLENVFGSISDDQRRACVELWLRNRVIPTEQAAWERSLQVCYFISKTSTGELVGVNTLYEGLLGEQGPLVYFNRMFLAPEYRNSRLMIRTTAMMLCYAKTRLADGNHKGVININENLKLARPGMQRIFERLGYANLGFVNSKQVWFFEFDQVKITEI